jgi:hypothetical protein
MRVPVTRRGAQPSHDATSTTTAHGRVRSRRAANGAAESLASCRNASTAATIAQYLQSNERRPHWQRERARRHPLPDCDSLPRIAALAAADGPAPHSASCTSAPPCLPARQATKS